ncbi:hypothetical protein U1839_25435 [Sphingomonas sp. RT2P30]|uniref:hypothetical protein n=1 Tax=Parasphingomonas halimpatiens TaxID=3096162 RepID=UPI002FC78893
MERLKYLLIWVVVSALVGVVAHYLSGVGFVVGFVLSMIALTLNGLIIGREDSI